MDIHKEAFRRFYMRPKYVGRRLAKIRTWDDIKRYAIGARVVFGMLGREKSTGH